MDRAPGDNNAASLFQADMLAPQQYQQTLRRKIPIEPERVLMFAVLMDGICCFQRYASARDKIRTRRFLEAKEWIMEEDNDRPFSFANICEVLSLSPQYIRAGLLLHKEKKLAEASKGQIYQFSAGRGGKRRACQR